MQVEPHNDPPPTLSYAGKLVEGSEYWRQQVDAAIDAGCAPEELRRYFKWGRDAAVYYGRAMSRRYAGKKDEPCLLCGAEPAGRLVRVAWMVRLNGSFFRATGEAAFTTRHRVCDRCANRGTRRIQLDRWWEGMGILGSLVLSFCLVALSVKMGQDAPVDSTALVLLNIFAILFLFLVNLGFQARSRERWRKQVRGLMPAGVSYTGVVGFSAAPKGDE